MRYRYINKAYHRFGAVHGLRCDPVKTGAGVCTVGRGKQLVRFEDGELVAVLRRCLRLDGQMPLFQKTE